MHAQETARDPRLFCERICHYSSLVASCTYAANVRIVEELEAKCNSCQCASALLCTSRLRSQLSRILKANHMAQSEAEVARKADTIMAQADKDGDGVVTFDGEFQYGRY